MAGADGCGELTPHPAAHLRDAFPAKLKQDFPLVLVISLEFIWPFRSWLCKFSLDFSTAENGYWKSDFLHYLNKEEVVEFLVVLNSDDVWTLNKFLDANHGIHI